MPRAFPGFRWRCCCCCCSGPSLACATAAGRCATDGISTAYARRALATAHAYRPRCSCAGRCHPGRSAVRRQRLCSIVCTRCVRSRDRDRMRGLGYRSCAAGRDIYMSNRAGVTCTIGWRGRAGTEERYRPAGRTSRRRGHTSLERTTPHRRPHTAGPRRRRGIVSRFVSIETTARAS